MNIKIDINVCRVCLQSGNGVKLFDEPTKYDQKFTKITQLKATKGDGFPELLCTKCVARLKIAHDFRVQSESSHDHLRQFLNEVNERFKVVSSTPEPEADEEYVEEILDAAYDELAMAKPKKLKPEPVSIVATSTTTRGSRGTVRISQATKKIVMPPKAKAEEPEVFIKDEISEVQSQSDDLTEKDHEIEENSSEDGHAKSENQSRSDSDDEMYEEHLEIEPYGAEVDPPRKKPRMRKRRVNSEETTHVCETCNKDFSTRTNLMRHMATHNGVKPYTCPICGNGFTQNGSLKQHMHIHTGTRPFQCEFCNRGFTQSKSLMFHIRRHTGEKPFTCTECNMSFRQKDGLKRHIAVKHSSEPKESWACEVCGKVLQSKYSVNMHMRKHYSIEGDGTEFDQYACNECERVFHTQNALQAHERQHSMITILKCSVCSQEFSNKAALMEHNKTHKVSSPSEDAKEVTHECSICHTTLSQLSHLKAHMSMQHNKRAKQFVCKVCNKSYAIQKNLTKHMHLHANIQKMEEVEVLEDEVVVGDEDLEYESIEQCDICSIGFITKDLLRQHQVSEHADELDLLTESDALDICFNCPSCELKFSDVVELNAHVQNAHDVTEAK